MGEAKLGALEPLVPPHLFFNTNSDRPTNASRKDCHSRSLDFDGVHVAADSQPQHALMERQNNVSSRHANTSI